MKNRSKEIKELQALNNILDEKINDENQPLFTDMICYIRGAKISLYNQELIRQDLTEMIISAQERGEKLNKFTMLSINIFVVIAFIFSCYIIHRILK